MAYPESKKVNQSKPGYSSYSSYSGHSNNSGHSSYSSYAAGRIKRDSEFEKFRKDKEQKKKDLQKVRYGEKKKSNKAIVIACVTAFALCACGLGWWFLAGRSQGNKPDNSGVVSLNATADDDALDYASASDLASDEEFYYEDASGYEDGSDNLITPDSRLNEEAMDYIGDISDSEEAALQEEISSIASMLEDSSVETILYAVSILFAGSLFFESDPYYEDYYYEDYGYEDGSLLVDVFAWLLIMSFYLGLEDILIEIEDYMYENGMGDLLETIYYSYFY